MTTSNWTTEIAYSNNYTTVLLYIIDGVTVAKQTIYYSDVFGNTNVIDTDF